MRQLGGVVLAGGGSTRMGRDKAALTVGGRTLLERSVDALRPLAGPVIVVGGHADLVAPAGCTAVTDHYPGAGPVGGILTALETLEQGWSLVVACDMPFLNRDLLALLVDHADDAYEAVTPWIDARPEPLCALYHTRAVPALQTFLAAGERAAHRALQALRVVKVPEADLRLPDPELASFININTPEEARRWLDDSDL